MKLTKFDIGAEIISIITKGMYPDPKDALREYIQNGVDAFAKEMSVKIRQESIVIDDNGEGMNYNTLRKAVRVGISDKNPTKNVGFMGIGIYSSYHLCDSLTIYSRGSENKANRLIMNFGKMRTILSDQREKRLNNQIQSEELIDLQTILESCITLTENGELEDTVFPRRGTRIELTSIEPEFYTALSDFDEIANYLRNVVPLKFNSKEFTYAEEIEENIIKICEVNKQRFELINLKLQVNSKIEDLYRPYRDIDFAKGTKPIKPYFHTLEKDDKFFGVAWGCLNSVRKKLENKSLRGFILKKQGFSIGNREALIKFFPRGNTFFDRYSGEVIIVNPNILPNASRNDIEYSPLRAAFYDAMAEVADRFDDYGHEFQEESKADEELSLLHREIRIQLSNYNEFEENPEALVSKIVALKRIYDKLNNRISRKGFSSSSEGKAIELKDQVSAFENTIQNRINTLIEKKKTRQQTPLSSTKLDLAKKVAGINVDKNTQRNNYETLYELLVDLEFNIEIDLQEVIHIIDEMFVQRTATNKSNYYELLNSLKERIQND